MTSWADQEEEEAQIREKEEELGITETTDENGFKIITEIKKDSQGRRVKHVKTIKVYTIVKKVNPNIEKRKKWKKFGDCAGLPPGLEEGITSISVDEINFQLGVGQQVEEVKEPSVSIGAVCRICGKVGEHWTNKCPLNKGGPVEPPATASPASGPGKYQHPNAKNAALGLGGSGGIDRRRDDLPTIRVTNLSEETRDSDLQELFRPFGPVSRIFLAKDKETNISKGFAFVSFIHREDAERAIRKLHGYGYDHLILHLEWARQSSGFFVSRFLPRAKKVLKEKKRKART